MTKWWIFLLVLLGMSSQPASAQASRGLRFGFHPEEERPTLFASPRRSGQSLPTPLPDSAVRGHTIEGAIIGTVVFVGTVQFLSHIFKNDSSGGKLGFYPAYFWGGLGSAIVGGAVGSLVPKK